VCFKGDSEYPKKIFMGGGLDNRKMRWVSWDRICQPKEKGGLGIQNLAIFNSSLLFKWKWRCLNDRSAPWQDLLRFRYGSLVANFMYGEGRIGLKQASIWWRDMWSLGSEEDGGWFGNNISSLLRDGTDICFWKAKWIGTVPLKEYFSNLFNISSQQDCTISAMGVWDSNDWRWKFQWRTVLSGAETDSAHELMLLLQHIRPTKETSDRRKWIPHAAGLFSVNSAYVSLLNRFEMDAIDPNTAQVLKKLWSTNIPSKGSVFGWRLVLEKLPTKEALFNKGIITSNFERCCVFCSIEEEDIRHVFFKCHMIHQVWEYIFKWMRVSFIDFSSVTDHFLSFGSIIRGKNSKKLRHIIWLATTWCIWRTRNNILFRGDHINFNSLVNQIVYIAWLWFIGRLRRNVDFSFSDWCNNPLDCFQRI
jgi:hypothetical protein